MSDGFIELLYRYSGLFAHVFNFVFDYGEHFVLVVFESSEYMFVNFVDDGMYSFIVGEDDFLRLLEGVLAILERLLD